MKISASASTCEICGKSINGGHPECSKKKQSLHAADKRPKLRKKRTAKDAAWFADQMAGGAK